MACFFAFMCWGASLHGQSRNIPEDVSYSDLLPEEAYELYPTLTDMYGFAVGKHADKILILGGLIRSEAPELFPEGFPNQELLLIDLGRRRATAFSSGALTEVLGEQLAAYGLAFHQLGETLYIVGGYGHAKEQNAFITFPYIVSVQLPDAIRDLLEGKNPEAHFRQHCDDRMALFNAILDHNGQEFFLMGGKRAVKQKPFARDPSYREEQPDEQVRTFRLRLKEGRLEVEGYQGWYDLNELEAVYGNQLPPKVRQAIDAQQPPQ